MDLEQKGTREGNETERVLELRTERIWLFIAGLDLESLFKGTWKKFVPTAIQLPWWGWCADGGCESHPEQAEQRSNSSGNAAHFTELYLRNSPAFGSH